MTTYFRYMPTLGVWMEYALSNLLLSVMKQRS